MRIYRGGPAGHPYSIIKIIGWAPKSHPIIYIKVGWAPSAHPIKRTKVAWALGAHPTFLLQTKPTSGLDLRCPDHFSCDLVVAPRATTSLKHSYQVWDVMPQATFVMHRKVLFLFAGAVSVNKL